MLIKQNQKSPNGIFVNVSEGALHIYNKSLPEGKETFASIKGRIFNVDFVMDEYQGKKFEKAQIFLKSEEKTYIVQMKTDSGYFRSFCNALKNGDVSKDVTITPSSKKENGKNQITCFVNQEGRYLKHYFTKDFKGTGNDILPDMGKVEFKGVSYADWTKVTEYWKNWLSSKFDQLEEQPEIEDDPTPQELGFEEDLPF